MWSCAVEQKTNIIYPIEKVEENTARPAEHQNISHLARAAHHFCLFSGACLHPCYVLKFLLSNILYLKSYQEACHVDLLFSEFNHTEEIQMGCNVNGKCVLSTKLRTIFKHVQSQHNKVTEKTTKFSQICMNWKHSLGHSNSRNMVMECLLPRAVLSG